MEQTPLLTYLRTWDHVWKHNIHGGSEFNRRAIGMKTASGTDSTFGSGYEYICTFGCEIELCKKCRFTRRHNDRNTQTVSGRRREKDPLKRKTHSIVLHRAGQHMRRKRVTLLCKEATQLVAPSRLKRPPPQTTAPILEKG